jgi:hypothetical protein
LMFSLQLSTCCHMLFHTKMELCHVYFMKNSFWKLFFKLFCVCLPLENVVNKKYFPVNGKYFPVKEKHFPVNKKHFLVKWKLDLVSRKVFSLLAVFVFRHMFVCH